jgi:hypothetical protein
MGLSDFEHMPLPKKLVPLVPHGSLPILILLDTSESANYPGLCSALETFLECLRTFHEEHISVNMIMFAETAELLYPEYIDVAECLFSPPEPKGSALFATACNLLYQHIHAWCWTHLPNIFLFSNGEFLDDAKKDALILVRGALGDCHCYFELSHRVVFTANAANIETLSEFTRTHKSVIHVDSIPDCKKLLVKTRREWDCPAFCDIHDAKNPPVDVGYCCSGVTSFSDEADSLWYIEKKIMNNPQEVFDAVSEQNVLWQALQRIRKECGDDIFHNTGMFKSVLADFITGIGNDISRLKKRTTEAVEMGVYKRLKDSSLYDVERVVRVEIKRLQDEGFNEETAKEIVYSFAKLLVAEKFPKGKWKQGISRGAVSVSESLNDIITDNVFEIGDDDFVW